MKKYLILALTIVLGLLFAGCGPGLFPQFTYQGVLTDSSGTPLSGAVTLKYKIYNSSSGGFPLYTETENVTLTNGRFDSVVGPSATITGLSPEALAQPLWIEVEVGNGTYTETLTPRQRLYGAPYAFTLMPGAVISQTFTTSLQPGGVNAVLVVDNEDVSDPLPALRVVGRKGIELTDPTSDDGNIYSDINQADSDLILRANDNIMFHLDVDGTGDPDNDFEVFYHGNRIFDLDESGELYIDGNFHSGGAMAEIASVGGVDHALYSMVSTGMWFEDFGAGQLVDGKGFVQIDPLYAQSVNLNVDYHVFLTPLGDCNGLYVAKKTPTGFEVRELGGGSASVAFDYRIVAKRAGYEDVRMEVVPMDAAGEGE